MTFSRFLPLAARSSVLIALGTGVMLAPPLLYMSPAAVVTGLLVGVIATGLGIAGTATSGRGTVPAVAHKGYDLVLAAGLGLASLAFAFGGDASAAALFGGAAIADFLMSANTRYSEAPA